MQTKPRSDPLRNFKFQVQIIHPVTTVTVANMAFTNVAGLSMNTEMVPYREGGWNTNFHKLPGQTDFGPVTLVQGVMSDRPDMWILAQQMFSVQWGGGGLMGGTDFRYTTVIRVLGHPLTYKEWSGAGGVTKGTQLAFVLHDCWTGSVAYNDLDAAGNAVLISQMTMHHEGFDVYWGDDAIAAGNHQATPTVVGA